MDKTKGNSQFKAFKIIVSEYISNEFNIDKKIMISATQSQQNPPEQFRLSMCLD